MWRKTTKESNRKDAGWLISKDCGFEAELKCSSLLVEVALMAVEMKRNNLWGLYRFLEGAICSKGLD